MLKNEKTPKSLTSTSSKAQLEGANGNVTKTQNTVDKLLLKYRHHAPAGHLAFSPPPSAPQGLFHRMKKAKHYLPVYPVLLSEFGFTLL